MDFLASRVHWWKNPFDCMGFKKNKRPAKSSSKPFPTVGLGELMRRHRKAARLTQLELAQFAEVGPAFLYALENGKPTLRFDKVLQVAKALGLVFVVRPRKPAEEAGSVVDGS